MIFVDRSHIAAPSVLTDPEEGGAKEKRKAKASLEAHRAAGKPDDQWTFRFDVYSRDAVKRALTELFHGKCAYCETRYAATQPMDVEHWRPKGQIEEEDGPHKPGYWWLAADWDNLLPSCIDCNRRRRQRDVVLDRTVNLGKLDQFPLLPESPRAADEGQEIDERPALVNPCLVDPAGFFEFDEQGVIRPRDDADAETRERARQSIRVYALNRSGLVQNRTEALRLAQLSVAIVKALADLQAARPEMSDSFAIVVDEMLSNELASLASRCRADRPYALMIRQVVRRELAPFLDADHGTVE